MSSKYFITRIKPEEFNPSFIAAGCCCEFENKVLFMKRHPQKPHGNTWGVPGGKVEENEDIRDCVIREVHEEAGLDIDDKSLKLMGTIYCRIPSGLNFSGTIDYIFHLFQHTSDVLPVLNIGLEEHIEAKWVTKEEALALDLIIGGKEVLDFYLESAIKD